MVIKNIDGLLTLIKNSYETLAPAQKSVARYIVESYQNIPFLSVTAMAREIGVSDTTIIKYCMQLGFSGYGDFKRQVTNAVQVNADWHSRFEAHLDSVGTKSAYSTYETEVKNLQGTFSNPINQQNYEVLLDALDRAETIYIMGFRSSSVLARFMSLSLGQIGYRTQLLAPEACDLYELSMLTGVRIIPPMMTFYHKPATIDDMVYHVVAKLLEPFGIEAKEYRRWNGL